MLPGQAGVEPGWDRACGSSVGAGVSGAGSTTDLPLYGQSQGTDGGQQSQEPRSGGRDAELGRKDSWAVSSPVLAVISNPGMAGNFCLVKASGGGSQVQVCILHELRPP